MSSPTARDLVTDWTEDFFTKPEVVKKCAQLARKYARKYPGLVYIDTSAGKNEFATLLCDDEKNDDISSISFDKYLYPETKGDVIEQDWLTVKGSQLPDNDTPIAVGFNPPFGRKYDILNDFMSHACSFEPDLIFLLGPARYQLPKEYRPWYDEVDSLEIPPFSFYKSHRGTKASIWEGPHYSCKFQVLQKRDSPKEIEKLQTKHPLVDMCKVSKLHNPDYFENPEDIILVRSTGNLAGHTYFLPQKNGTLDEYRLNEYKGNWKNWTDRGYSGSTFDCLNFKKPHPSTKTLRKELLEEWKKMCPASFVPNTSSFSITKSQFCTMLNNIL